MTVRWRLDLAYDGGAFSGWAAQPGLRTVQGVLEQWIPRVLRLPEPVRLVCAGRTDAGVHARGQVVHVDLPDDAAVADLLQRRLDRVLPSDVVVRHVDRAPAGFDARFSAVWRRYVYRINDGLVPPDPLLRGHVTAVRRRLDLDAMNSAAGVLLGLHDFAAFCKRREGATTIRTLLELSAGRDRHGDIEFTVRADAFCHSMVRSLMGAITAIGSGQREVGWLAGLLTSPAREPAIQVMAAHGLCLEEVGYPPDAELAARAELSRATREVAEP